MVKPAIFVVPFLVMTALAEPQSSRPADTQPSEAISLTWVRDSDFSGTGGSLRDSMVLRVKVKNDGKTPSPPRHLKISLCDSQGDAVIDATTWLDDKLASYHPTDIGALNPGEFVFFWIAVDQRKYGNISSIKWVAIDPKTLETPAATQPAPRPLARLMVRNMSGSKTKPTTVASLLELKKVGEDGDSLVYSFWIRLTSISNNDEDSITCNLIYDWQESGVRTVGPEDALISALGDNRFISITIKPFKKSAAYDWKGSFKVRGKDFRQSKLSILNIGK